MLLPRIAPNEEGTSLTFPICKYYLWELDVTRNSTRAQANLSQCKFMKTQKVKKAGCATKSSTKFGENTFFFSLVNSHFPFVPADKISSFVCIVNDLSEKLNYDWSKPSELLG